MLVKELTQVSQSSTPFDDRGTIDWNQIKRLAHTGRRRIVRQFSLWILKDGTWDVRPKEHPLHSIFLEDAISAADADALESLPFIDFPRSRN